jgi:hypothetical protein
MREHSVRLDQLPEGVVFPPELKDRVFYDATKKRLVFRGFMTKAEHDRLSQLSHDLQYVRALEQLFVAAANGSNGLRWTIVMMAAIVVAGLAVAALCVWYFRR